MLGRPVATIAIASIELHCPGQGQPASATVSLSTGDSGRYDPRSMSIRYSHLNYNLYADFARQQIAGDGSRGTVHLQPIPTGETVVYPIFAVIPPHQRADPGHYEDRIVVTVEF